MGLGGLFGAIGSVAGAAISAEAVKQATQMQIDALNRQRLFTYANLDPSVVGPVATRADQERAVARLALQGQIDPALLQQRYAAEAAIGAQAGALGPGSQADKVARVAAGEAVAGTPGMPEAKAKLVDAALNELKAGATLPPDVQAELMKSGLESAGMVTQGASGQGIGGTMLRTILGKAGIELQQKRQQQATALLTGAQNLDSSRQAILQGLFPSLNAVQLQNLGAQQGVLSQSNSMLPNAGLSGSDVANIWLARVGATNSLASQAASVGAAGAMGQGQAWAGLAGAGAGIGRAIQNAWPSSSATTDTGINSSTPYDAGGWPGW